MAAGTVIVGGGLAGLNCARLLNAAGREFVLLEASDRTGGRVRTEVVTTSDGSYLVDRGFQVLLTAYPNAAAVFDYEALDLRTFYPGALVWFEDGLHRVADPRRRMGDALRGFRSPIATMRDKIRLGEVFLRVLGDGVERLWEQPERPAIDALRAWGFAESTIDRFFRPFFGGVFFDLELQTSSRMLEFCMRMFAMGRTCVPARGMGELASQLTALLPSGTVRVGERVERLERRGDGWVVHTGSEAFAAETVVMATEGDVAHEMIEDSGTHDGPPMRWRSTATVSYAADEAPTDEAILVLDGEGTGPVNHLACMSRASEAYAPAGKHLVYANVVDPAVLAAHGDDGALDRACRPQLRRWFGEAVDGWSLIHVDRIEKALPDQRPPWLSDPQRGVAHGGGLFTCGDWLENASIDGALGSGKRCAEAVLADAQSARAV